MSVEIPFSQFDGTRRARAPYNAQMRNAVVKPISKPARMWVTGQNQRAPYSPTAITAG